MMIEERITHSTDGQGEVVDRTVIRDDRSGPVTVNNHAAPDRGNSGIIFIAIFALALILGYFLFMRDGEARKDNAIAEAANDVGAAAEKAGNAAEKATDELTK